jgi:hypothetical protein
MILRLSSRLSCGRAQLELALLALPRRRSEGFKIDNKQMACGSEANGKLYWSLGCLRAAMLTAAVYLQMI